MLALFEALGAQFTESHEAILRWSWKLFCRKWCRMMERGAADKRRERARKRRQREEEERRELRERHRAGTDGW